MAEKPRPEGVTQSVEGLPGLPPRAAKCRAVFPSLQVAWTLTLASNKLGRARVELRSGRSLSDLETFKAHWSHLAPLEHMGRRQLGHPHVPGVRSKEQRSPSK